MAQLKIVLYYNQTSGGWTETWYRSGDIPISEIPAGDRTVLREAISFRAPLTKLYAIRYTDVASPRKTSLFRLNGAFSATVSSTDAPDVRTTDAVYSVYSSDLNLRRISLRGLPDDGVKRNPDGTNVLTPGFSAGVDRYLKATLNNTYQIRIQSTPFNSALVAHQVTLLAAHPTNTNWSVVSVNAAIDAEFSRGKQVRFLGIPKNELVGFPLKTTSLGPDGAAVTRFIIPYRWRGGLTVAPKNMQVLLLQYQYKNVFGWEFENFSERKVGRPFGVLRGRARAVATSR